MSAQPANPQPAGGTPADDGRRAEHERWLLELTSIPTVAGREGRVIEWIRRWAAERPDVTLAADDAGNLTLALAQEPAGGAPVYFTAHLDHPAFAVAGVGGSVELEFRGGVMDAYFQGARAVVHTVDGPARVRIESRLTPEPAPHSPHARWSARAEMGPSGAIRVGDVATWDLPPSRIEDGLLHAPACDDLAAAAGALGAFDLLRGERVEAPVRVLFTRAEEIGFVGAIAACRLGTLPRGARIIALENSRASDDAPVGGGPIVRVGDRISIFSPSLTNAISARAQEIAGRPAVPPATQRATSAGWKWQRKLMAGGACEATVFCAAGHEATCVCLPLGNYHNMGELSAVQAGTNSTPPTIAPEFISIADFHGMVDLLVGCGRSLPASASVHPLIEKLWSERRGVLDETP